MVWLAVAAALAALGQAFFAYLELQGWGVPFVKSAAKAWAKPVSDPDQPAAHFDEHRAAHLEKQLAAHVEWARRLARNMGSYNLLLALALAWTAWAAWQNWPSAVPFAVLLGLFLLGAAAAAGLTEVYKALVAQGILGALLLAAVWLA